MKKFIKTVLQCFRNIEPARPTHSSYPNNTSTYGAKTQYAPNPDASQPLSPSENT